MEENREIAPAEIEQCKAALGGLYAYKVDERMARPLHQQVAYRRFPVAPSGLPVSESLPERILCLPMHPYLSTSDQDRVIDTIRHFVGDVRRVAAE